MLARPRLQKCDAMQLADRSFVDVKDLKRMEKESRASRFDILPTAQAGLTISLEPLDHRTLGTRGLPAAQ